MSFGDGHTDDVRVGELTKVASFGAGDKVTWHGGCDEGVPKGAVGEVVGFNDRGRARVRFPKGTWNFLPAELRKDGDKGITPGKKDGSYPLGPLGMELVLEPSPVLPPPPPPPPPLQ